MNERMQQKELILRLIKDDLINTCLIDSFETIGFYSDDYRLHLSDTLFKVMEIDDANDELFESYLEKTSEVADLTIIKDKKILEKRAEQVYSFLMQNKNK